MTYAVIGLGSNRAFEYFDQEQGGLVSLSPVQIFMRASTELEEGVLEKVTHSSVYSTSPMYYYPQEDFYNMVLSGYYKGSAMDLLRDIHEIENRYGRDRTKEIRNGPRSLDLDIELFGHCKICEEKLVVPHERLLERSFVLTPLVEVLNLNADVFNEDLEFYKDSLRLLGDQGISLCMTREEFEAGRLDFKSLRNRYGTGRNRNSDKNRSDS